MDDSSLDARQSSPVAAPRLNLFALPSRTTLLFLLILLVIYVPLIAALASNSPVCAPFILFWMVLLPLRHFLRGPERAIEKYNLSDASDTPLAESVRYLAHEIARVQSPQVKVSPQAADAAWTFGAFRRSYLAFSRGMAQELERTEKMTQEEAAPSRAIVLHELAHIRHKDVALVILARSVLVVTIGFMALALCVHLLTPFLYYRFLTFYDFSQPPFSNLLSILASINPEIPSALDPANPIMAARWVDYAAFILAAFAPLMLGAVLLLLFLWRALLRTRELYADARVVEWQDGDSEPLWRGLRIATLFQDLRPASEDRGGKFRRCHDSLKRWIRDRLPRRAPWETMRAWLSLHPSDKQRSACLHAPHQVYGSDLSIALTAGAGVVLLNVNLLSLFYSQTLRGPNSVPAFALGFTVISLSLLPFLCQFQGKLRALLPKVAKIVLVFTGVKLIPQYLGAAALTLAALADPNILQRTLEGVVRADLPAGFAAELTGLFLENFVVRPAILFTFFMPAFLIGYLFLYLWLVRKMLHWYSADFLARHSAIVLAYVTALFALLLIFCILPFVDWVTIPTAHDPLAPDVFLPMFGVGLLAVGHLVLFALFERWCARLCPSCKSRITREYELGMRCTQCGALLNPWLVANASPAIYQF